MRHDLSTRAVDARELMDDDDADEVALAQTYLRFRTVNALISGPGAVYRRDVRPRARAGRIRILDVGAGGGDLCRALAASLRRDGLTAEITALDPDERAMRWAEAHDAGAGIRYRCADTREVATTGETFDVVLSNHLMHHLTVEQLGQVLADTRTMVSDGGIVAHHDIARSAVAYALYTAVTWPFARNFLAGSFIREDGLTSIRRSYTAAELRALAPEGWTVQESLPARLQLRWDRGIARR